MGAAQGMCPSGSGCLAGGGGPVVHSAYLPAPPPLQHAWFTPMPCASVPPAGLFGRATCLEAKNETMIFRFAVFLDEVGLR